MNLFLGGERKGWGAGVWSFGCERSLNIALFKILLTLGKWMVLSISFPSALLSSHTKCQQLTSSHPHIPAARVPSQGKKQAAIWLPALQKQRSFEYLCKEGLNLWDLARAVTLTHSVSPNRDELSLQRGFAQLYCLLPHHFTCTRWISLTLHNHLGYQT